MMRLLHKLGEHAKAIASIFALLAMIGSAAVAGTRAYVRGVVNEFVMAGLEDFRVEWRCSEWSEELENVLNALADDIPETVEQRTRLELRRDRLEEAIRANNCAEYEV